ncbi:hypothetical protein, partial [Microbacterium sp. Root180]|uniref:hypothetical protein n=1 Tax=Microbacterium sp. Root180 TaxID=1736483 RepID=UPI001F2A1566
MVEIRLSAGLVWFVDLGVFRARNVGGWWQASGMEAVVDTLGEVERVLGGAVAGVFDRGELRLSGDEELLAVAARVSAVSRLADALLVAVV